MKETDSLIIIEVGGGLGNQMQQYAMYRKLLHAGKDVRLDFSWFLPENQRQVLTPREPELTWFIDIPYEVCTGEERDYFLNRTLIQKGVNRLLPSTSRIWEETGQYHPELMQMTGKYLRGNFLCNKYYEGMWDELVNLFRFPKHSDEACHQRNLNLMQKMSESDSVSIHFRRGDYLDRENAALFGGITTDQYYQNAMDYFLNKWPDAHFYLFTNDVPYACERYADNPTFTIIDWNTDRNNLLDMQLMSCCRGNICANSTFSFWGARLNTRTDREVIRPYRMRNNQTYHPDQMHDYWRDWILMDEDGVIV